MTELGLTALAVDKLPEVKTHGLGVPRIAILHTWTNTQNEGWYRIEFDRSADSLRVHFGSGGSQHAEPAREV